MSAKRSAAIGTLVRWRAFQEAIAEREYQQASARVLDASAKVDEAQAKAEAIAAHREDMLGRGALDLALLQAVAGFEHRALDVVREKTEVLDECTAGRDRALEGHLRARSATRVAETRRDEVAAEENDVEEKRIFDRMASLIVAADGRRTEGGMT